MEIVPIGGRVKSASVGLNHLYTTDDVVELNAQLRALRKKPMAALLEAFFPNDRARLKQMMEGIGFYRPVLKTDQGMAGNFLPFSINQESSITDLSVRRICEEEGIAIPEVYYACDPKIVHSIQKEFNTLNFEKVNDMLQQVGSTRRANKGRMPFFLIKPAFTDKEIVFGQDIITYVVEAVNTLLQDIIQEANKKEKEYSGKYQPSNLVYCQPDVFILADGTVVVERINCPDVGLFLGKVDDPFSQILPLIQRIIIPLQKAVCEVLASNIDARQVVIITRDEVLKNQEDVLEITEIKCLKEELEQLGVQVDVYSLSQVDRIPVGQKVILLNIDYGNKKAKILLDRHCSGELICYPNPFFQMACNNSTGLQEIVVSSKYLDRFLQLIGSVPKNDDALLRVWQQLDRLFCKYNIKSDIIYADIGREVVPIFRRSLHSWRLLNRRVARYNGTTEIKLRLVPVSPEKLIITSDTGPRLHTFRFMFVKSGI